MSSSRTALGTMSPSRAVSFIRLELSGWTALEVSWMVFCVAAVLGISLWLKDSAIGIIAAITGIMYTLIAGKGKCSCYLFGIVNTIGYGLVSYHAKLLGETMLNWGYYLPMMFIGLIFWSKRLDEKAEIVKTALTWKGRAITAALSILGIALYAIVLAKLQDPQPILDSTTTILSITAMVLTVKRCIEQWLLWTIVNATSIILWLKAYLDGYGSIATLLYWCVALANGIIFFIKWRKEIKQ